MRQSIQSLTKTVWSMALGMSLALVAVSCGPKAPTKIDSAGKGSSDASSKSCTKQNCKKIELAITSANTDSADLLTGHKGQMVDWTFSAVAADGMTQRKIGLYFMDLPNGASANSDFSPAGSIDWTPTLAGRGASAIKVVARDIQRCEVIEGASAQCNDSTQSFPEYEQSKSFSYSIGESSTTSPSLASSTTMSPTMDQPAVVRVSDPNCGGVAPTSNGQVLSQGLSTGTQVLGGLLGGGAGILGMAVKFLPSLIGGVAGGNQSAQPSQC